MRITEALAYLKADIPADDPAPVIELDDDDSPVLVRIAEGLLASYIVDEGERFSYVQNRHLRNAGLTTNKLHDIAITNLANLANGRLTIRHASSVWALFLDGNFEASLILLNDLWDQQLHQYHGGELVVAVPARDILAFCKASSADGIAELRAVIERVWPAGDHLISNSLFRRVNKNWVQLRAAS